MKRGAEHDVTGPLSYTFMNVDVSLELDGRIVLEPVDENGETKSATILDPDSGFALLLFMKLPAARNAIMKAEQHRQHQRQLEALNDQEESMHLGAKTYNRVVQKLFQAEEQIADLERQITELEARLNEPAIEYTNGTGHKK